MIRPIGSDVLVQLEEPKQESSVIISAAKSKFRTALVLAVGPSAVQVKTGERVLFPAVVGSAVGGNLLVVEEDMITGVIDE